MKIPKSAEVKTTSALVRLLGRMAVSLNNLETRIKQLEKDAKKTAKKIEQLQKDIIYLTASKPATLEKKP